MDRNTKRWIFDIAVWTTTLIAALVLLASAEAAEHRRASAANPEWRTECGSCHVPYPPQLLPAASWRALMSGLDQHFGSSASLDAKSAASISAYLQENAGRDAQTSRGALPLRITRTRWFEREHAEVPSAFWARSDVKKSDCAACHPGASDGDFDHTTLRLPH